MPGRPGRRRPASVLAVDAGGSKVEVALLTSTGTVLGAARWARRDHGPAADGEDPVVTAVAPALQRACRAAGIPAGPGPVAALGYFCMAGDDFPADERRLTAQLRRRGWADDVVVRNDTFAVLRAGSEQGWGVAVVCGFGTNCSAVAPDGRTFRFPALGALSGDWGGGSELGPTALWFAVRAQDGRGVPTLLRDLVPAHFGLKRPSQVVEAINFGRVPERRLYELAPLLFRAARRGDEVARSVLDRQADEIATMATAAMRRLRLTGLDTEVVLGGGIVRSGDRAFVARIERGIGEVAPAARVTVLRAPPVVGAALLGLERQGASARALASARAGLTEERMRNQAAPRAGRG